MANPPEDLPIWATAGSAEITEPATSQKTNGWRQEDRPPHQYVNWFWNLVYQWVVNLSQGAARFETLEDACEYLSIGETGFVDEAEYGDRPGSDHSTFQIANAPRGLTTVDGIRVYYLTDPGATGFGDLTSRDRDLAAGAPTVTTYVRTNAGTWRRAATNGADLVAAYGQYLECWTPGAGASRWVYDHGATIRDVCVDGDYAYLVGDAGTGGFHLRRVRLSDGVVSWSYDHGAALYSVATNGRQVFVWGDTSGSASASTLRAVNADSGADFNGEGGIGTDAAAQSWNDNVVAANAHITGEARLATDGDLLFLGFEVGDLHQIEARGAADGEVIATLAFGYDVISLACDHEYLYALVEDSATDAYVYALKKETLALAWRRRFNGGIADTCHVSSDGFGVFLVNTNTTPFELTRLHRLNRPTMVRRQGSQRHAPFPLLALPIR